MEKPLPRLCAPLDGLGSERRIFRSALRSGAAAAASYIFAMCTGWTAILASGLLPFVKWRILLFSLS